MAKSLAGRSTKALQKKARRGFAGHPIATVAYYGPDDRRATKVAVAIIPAQDEEPAALERWFGDERDVRRDHSINDEILKFIRQHEARSVVMTDGIIGCPHEEGIDYPEGATCPHCPFWAGRDRWSETAASPATPTIECFFISVEDESPDQVIAFSCAREVWDQENDVMLHRTPRYEPVLPPEERGCRMSIGYDTDRSAMLEWVRVEGDVIELKAGELHARCDCSRVDLTEWQDMLQLLRAMSADGAFQLTVA